MAKKSIKGVWLSISQIDMKFATKGIFINNLFKRVVGIGDKTVFWKDYWCGFEGQLEKGERIKIACL